MCHAHFTHIQWPKSHKVFIYLHLLTCACLIKFEAPEQWVSAWEILSVWRVFQLFFFSFSFCILFVVFVFGPRAYSALPGTYSAWRHTKKLCLTVCGAAATACGIWCSLRNENWVGHEQIVVSLLDLLAVSFSFYFAMGVPLLLLLLQTRVAWDSCNMQIGACHAAFRQLKSCWWFYLKIWFECSAAKCSRILDSKQLPHNESD